MPLGQITENIDVAQVTLYVFWVFFALLIFYLRREDRREGYPLESDPSGEVKGEGFLFIPEPKTFALPHGGTVTAPNGKRDDRPIKARRTEPWPGAPLEPTGNPLVDAVGPASYAERADEPDRTFEGHLKIVPMRVADDFAVARRDVDPRGLPVYAADGAYAGNITDIWVDRAESLIRYYEMELESSDQEEVSGGQETPSAQPAPVEPEVSMQPESPTETPETETPETETLELDSSDTVAQPEAAAQAATPELSEQPGAEEQPEIATPDVSEPPPAPEQQEPSAPDAETERDRTAADSPRVLIPANCAVVSRSGMVTVNSILASQFADVPRTAAPDKVTLLEEDRIMGYYAGGNLYATRERSEPLI